MFYRDRHSEVIDVIAGTVDRYWSGCEYNMYLPKRVLGKSKDNRHVGWQWSGFGRWW